MYVQCLLKLGHIFSLVLAEGFDQCFLNSRFEYGFFVRTQGITLYRNGMCYRFKGLQTFKVHNFVTRRNVQYRNFA